MSTPACQCDFPPDASSIVCERHNCRKFRRLVELCNAGARGENPGLSYWLAFEEGRGPGQSPPPAPEAVPSPRRAPRQPCGGKGVGDRVSQALSLVGITEERVSAWLGRPCGCKERREKLNQIGRWAARVLSGKTEDAETYLDKIIENGEGDPMAKAIRWAYGVTTVPERLDDLLPRTLHSLATGGFGQPRLFVDGAKDDVDYRHFDLEVTTRHPAVRPYGNWILSLAELYIRDSQCHRYAIFQDDLLTYRNLRQYLEQCKYPDRGYWNLYTYPHNLLRARGAKGWFPSDQLGKGGLGLVFSRDAVAMLLTHQHMVQKPQDANRGWKTLDGAVLTAMKNAGWKEYVHNPSLVQHTGTKSTMGKPPAKLADSFMGEEFDAMELLA